MQYNWKKNTGIFLASQAVSIFGSSLVQYAITWHITITTQSGLYATLSIICGFLPTFFLSPFAGVWADRYNRKRLIALADGFIAASTLVLAVLFILGYQEIWLLLVVMAIRSCGSAIQNPAVNAMLPDMVPKEHLTRVNGINSSLQSSITLISPIISGALMGFAPLQAIFFIDVITAAVAIVILLGFFRMPDASENKTAPDNGNYWQEMKAGFAYIGKTKYLRNLFMLLTIFCFMSAPIAFLTPLQVTRSFGSDIWRLTAIEMAFSIGMIVGGLVISAWGGLKNRVHTMALTYSMMALGIIVLGLPLNFWVYLAMMAFVGITMPMFNTPAIVMMQEKVDPNYLGRVMSVITMINSGLMPLGMLLFGPLADVMPIEWLLLASGTVLLLCTVLLLRDKALLEAGRPVPAARASAD